MKIENFNWEVGFSYSENESPAIMFPAVVPGAVQLDYARYKNLEPYWIGENFKTYKWMEDVFWTYRTVINIPENDVTLLNFKGIDYQYLIKVNGTEAARGEGMFTPVQLDLSVFLGQAVEILAVLFPVPKAEGESGRAQARETLKPAVSYGWDWHPQLIPTGIWDEVYLEILPKSHIANIQINYTVSEDLSQAEISFDADIRGGTMLRLTLLDNLGETVFSTENTADSGSIKAILKNPKLWWPIGYGEQNLYKAVFELTDGEKKHRTEKRFGLRKVALIMNEGEKEKPRNFPKSQYSAPITLMVNNVKIFAKGANWVNPEIFPGIITEDTYKPLIKLAVDAHMNIFRVWGGGIVNKSSFYELCDENGIMVWQEFPLACNNYPESEGYLEILEQEAVSIIDRLKFNPSVLMWCGGNELFNGWSGMTEQHAALRLLNRITFEKDKGTPFLMTSPVVGMAHGHYMNVEKGREFITDLVKCENTAYTEFGCPGPAPFDYLKSFIDESEFEDFIHSPVFKSHHAFEVWGEYDTWFRISEAEYFFGGYHDLEDLTEKLTLIQAICSKAMFEEMRKQWPRCAMAIIWCFSEPWPTAANNSIINWQSTPKLAYSYIKEALRPVLCSLRAEKHRYHAGEQFSAELWMLNDSGKKLPAGKIEVYSRYNGVTTHLLDWHCPSVNARANMRGPSAFLTVPRGEALDFELILKRSDIPEAESCYRYFIKNEKPTIKRNMLNR